LSQHFLLSAAARSLSLGSIFRMTDDEARDAFKRIRWSGNNAEPFCPHCGCLIVYTLAETPPRWKCSACRRKFSLTSGTLFHSRKLAVRDYLAVIALFINGVKGTSALQISRDLNINPKSSFVLLHKIREAMGSQVHNPDEPELSGTVEIDGAYFGGHVKPENRRSVGSMHIMAGTHAENRHVRCDRQCRVGFVVGTELSNWHIGAWRVWRRANSGATHDLSRHSQPPGSREALDRRSVL
jgi:transposase-like protein